MEWIKRLNKAIHYIEENLTYEIEYEELAKIACCSTYHFQRMFAYIANVPLSEYIRRRRMTMAAVDLQSSDEKVISISAKYGYESPTAFNRAFQAVHGIPPSQARAEGVSLKAYPPISFKITINGVVEMNYRIEKKDTFRIIGVAEPIEMNMEESFKIVPKMWLKAGQNGTLGKLAPFMTGEPKGILGICAVYPNEKYKYFIAVSNSADNVEGFEEYNIPAATWAIFRGEGPMPTAIQELEKRIMTEWFPSSGYEYANGPDIEVYINDDMQNSIFEVWIPVIKK